MSRRASWTRIVGVLAVIGIGLATVAPAAADAGPPSRAWRLCEYHIATDRVHLADAVRVGTRGEATSYWVRVRNVNILPWSGRVELDRLRTHPPMWLWPGRSHWLESRVHILSRHSNVLHYDINILPNSDATFLSVEIFC